MRIVKFLLYCAVLYSAGADHEEIGSAAATNDCLQPVMRLTNCSEENQIRLFHFSEEQNRCRGYKTCALPDQDETPNVFDSRSKCEENCPATRCIFPVKPNSGSYYLSQTQDGKVIAHYSCQNPYTIVGDSERKCLYDGSWSGEDPTCETPTTTTCDEPPDVDFSMKFKLCSGDQTPGCRVIYGCQKGYKLVYGSITKTCGIDGHWSDDIHICARLVVMHNEEEVSVVSTTEDDVNVEIRCMVEPSFPPDAVVIWDPVGEHSNTSWASDRSAYLLKFPRVTRKDAGYYDCKMNGLKQDFELVVNAKPLVIPPTLLAHLYKITSNLIQIKCLYSGEPKPNVLWYFNETLITTDHDSRIAIYDYLPHFSTLNFNILTITNPTQEDSGIYTCESNEAVETRGSIYIEIPVEDPRRQRSLQTEPDITKDKEEIISSFCTDQTTNIFIGMFGRKLKSIDKDTDNYFIKIDRTLQSSFSKTTTLRENSVIEAKTLNTIVPKNFSRNQLYIFIVRTDTNNENIVTNFFPYDSNVEEVFNTVCK